MNDERQEELHYQAIRSVLNELDQLRGRVAELETALWEVGDFNDNPDQTYTQHVVQAVLGEGWWHRRPDPARREAVRAAAAAALADPTEDET